MLSLTLPRHDSGDNVSAHGQDSLTRFFTYSLGLACQPLLSRTLTLDHELEGLVSLHWM